MKKPTKSIPLHDYTPALQGAVSWLGDRYLLAEPVTRRSDERKHHFNTRPQAGGAVSVRVSH